MVMEQIATTVMENAWRAGEARDQAKTVPLTAVEGGKVMSAANEAMERISASSAKISNIFGMIDDIAFQTNLPAHKCLRRIQSAVSATPGKSSSRAVQNLRARRSTPGFSKCLVGSRGSGHHNCQ